MLFFVFGVAVGRQQLRVPVKSSLIALALLFILGLKAGQYAEVEKLPEVGPLWVFGTLVSLGSALLSFLFFRLILSQVRQQAAAWACHFGSVSAVTFVATMEYLDSVGVPISALAPTIMAWMEVPGLILGVYLAERQFDASIFRKLLKFMPIFVGWGLGLSLQALNLEIPVVKQILIFTLLAYLFVIAWENSADFKIDLIKTAPGPLFISVFLNVLAGSLALLSGFSVGDSTWLGILAGSASYLAAPAVVRGRWSGIDENQPLLGALFIVFPWNLIIGIPMALTWLEWLNNYLK